jgi:hypothetical protein
MLVAQLAGFLANDNGRKLYCTRKNAQVVTNLQRAFTMLFNNLSTGCVRTACSQLVDNLLQGC